MERAELPLDILDKCVEAVPSWDGATLQSCALAGRILRPSSQRVLFSTPYFSVLPDLATGLKRWRLFCTALDTSSDLGQHVRALTVNGIPMDYDILLPAFSKVRNLTQLTIASQFKRRYILWAELEIQTQRLLRNDIFPRLTDLNLEGLKEIPVIIFESLPSLKMLGCSDSILPLDKDTPIVGAETNPRPLAHLDLHYTASSSTSNHTSIVHLLDYLIRYQCRLHKLDLSMIHTPETSLNDLIRLISLCKTSLRRLSFYSIDKFLRQTSDVVYNGWFHGIFKLDQYSSLTNLSMEFTLDNYPDFPVQEQFIRRLALVLASGQPTLASTGLQFVSIDIDVESFPPRGPSFWLPIMEALTVIHTLEKVSFIIRLWDFNWAVLAASDESEKATIELSAYLPWKQELEEALKEVGLVAKSEIKLDMDFAVEPTAVHND
ncbi:hypothetical protein DL96DRAFT_1580828, partial [Flagelloscypha sp. PMI_526]